MAMESTESSSSSSKQKNDKILQFAQLGSTVHEGFWKAFADLKLDSLRISEEPIPLTGFYAPASHGQVSNHLKLLSESIHISSEGEGAFSGNRNLCPVPGVLYNTNTLESFKAIDRNALFKKEVTKIWDDIRSGRAEKDCSLLCRFLLISYADLKKWDFYYWFAFPALVMDPPALVTCIGPASEVFNKVEGSALLEACKVWRQSASTTEAFFLVHFMSNADVRVRPLRDWNVCCQKGGETLLGFYDPCHLPSNPGWPLRNFLAFASVWWGLKKVRVLCYREKSGFGALNNCLVADLQLPHQAGWSEAERIPPAVGWERNEHGKMTPRYVKLSTHMDPVKLAVSAADLNLKLMRWRSAPSLDLQRLASTKCLLLGAGTLGCQVARGLMAWGIRNITFVDAGRVSMSNPLRQSLYGYEDCLNGGQLKATSAAKSLQAIFPGVEATGVNMTIPMPGHCVSEEELSQLKANCMQLKELVANHDVVFLLTDTRESRWLPTLLCAEANKVAITAAIGFGSFLVMRHGAGIGTTNSKGASGNITVGNSDSMDLREATEPSRDLKGKRERLSCYFCSDIVAPKDSTQNLTLDQQCTVTRPGLAPVAAALAVEMTVGILHHPLGVNAPADDAASDDINHEEQPLGILPHQIRGEFFRFSQLVMKGCASSACVACSDKVVTEFRKRGLEFLVEVITQPAYLVDLTGITELTKSNTEWESDTFDDETDSFD